MGALALFISLGGAGYAARVVHMIDGSTIKKHSIRLDRLTRDAQAGLRGQKGAAGPTGPQGVSGPRGARGPKGDPGTNGSALAFAYIARDGSVIQGKNITNATVDKIGTGEYCIGTTSAVPTIRNVTATLADESGVANEITAMPHKFVVCPDGFMQALVSTFKDGSGSDAAFSVLFN